MDISHKDQVLTEEMGLPISESLISTSSTSWNLKETEHCLCTFLCQHNITYAWHVWKHYGAASISCQPLQVFLFLPDFRFCFTAGRGGIEEHFCTWEKKVFRGNGQSMCSQDQLAEEAENTTERDTNWEKILYFLFICSHNRWVLVWLKHYMKQQPLHMLPDLCQPSWRQMRCQLNTSSSSSLEATTTMATHPQSSTTAWRA